MTARLGSGQAAALAAALLMTTACSETATKGNITTGPTVTGTLGGGKLGAQALGLPGTTWFYKDNQAGRAELTNDRNTPRTFVFIVFNATDQDNQKDMGNATYTLAAGETRIVTVGVHRRPEDPRCKPITIQPDIFSDPPPLGANGLYTMSDVRDHLYGGGSLGIFPAEASGCDTPQPPTCVVGASETKVFAADAWLMSYPPTLLNPWYPNRLGPFTLTAALQPHATYHFSGLSGDPLHLAEPDDSPDQWHEQWLVETSDGQRTQAGQDVPEDQPTIAVDLGDLTIGASPVSSFQVIHAGPVGENARDSVRPMILTITKVCR